MFSTSVGSLNAHSRVAGGKQVQRERELIRRFDFYQANHRILDEWVANERR